MEIRRLKQEEAASAVQLSDQVFRDSEQKSMGAAFPTLFLPEVIDHSYGCFIDGKLVSFMGLSPGVLRVGPAKLSIYSLGSVCTDPKSRGKGYASKILEAIMGDMRQTDASLMLISGGRSLYTRVGCHPFGKTKTFYVKKEDVTQNVRPDTATFREAKTTDILGIARLAAERKVAYEQTAHDIALLIKSEAYASCIKRQHRVWVAERQGELAAYLIFALPYPKDVETDAVAIEWGGEAELVKALVDVTLQRLSLVQFKLCVPWFETALINAFNHVEMKSGVNYGTVYVSDPKKLFHQLTPYLDDHHPEFLQKTAVKISKIGVELEYDGKIIKLAPDAFISFLFTPGDGIVPGIGNLAVPLPYTAGLNYI